MKKIAIIVLTLLLIVAIPAVTVTPVNSAALSMPDTAKIQELTTKGLEQVAESSGLLLYADSERGNIALYNKANSTFWYSNPQEYMGEKLVGQDKVLTASQMEITYYDQQFLQNEALSYTGSVNKGGLSCQKISNGVQFTYRFQQQGFTIPLCYTLKDSYMEVSVPIDEVKEDGEYILGDISVLPFFGCAAEKEEGYIFVPDGTGALINFQNDSNTLYGYSQPLYGDDRVMTKVRQMYNTETAYMPVLGIHKENGGMLCVIDEGAGLAKANAMLATMKKKRNMAYFSFRYRPANWLTLNSADRNAREVVAFSQSAAMIKSFSMRYYPLQGEGTYYDMAAQYRNYLIQDKGMTKSKTDNQDMPFYVTSYGAIKKRDSVFFIPKDVVMPLTTYSQMSEMLTKLHDNGIRNTITDYRGWYQGGFTGKMPVKGKLENKLGSKAELEQLLETVKKLDGQLFAGLNLVDFYSTGNGFSKSKAVARSVTQAPALQNRFSLIHGFQDYQFTPWYLLSPLQYSRVIDGFQQSYQQYPFSGIGLGAAGSEFYSDFRKNGADRLKMESVYIEAFKNAGENKPVLADSVNSFLLPYVDYIAGTPVENSHYDIESCRVPFYQIVISGYKSYAVPAVNLSRDADMMLLYAIETGASLQYLFNAQNSDELTGTCLQSIYNSDYRHWEKDAAEQYQKVNAVYQKTKGGAIINHTKPTEDVACVTYDNGTIVVVNYGNTAYQSQWGKVEPRSYIVSQTGGAT